MKTVLIVASLILLSACVHESAMPLGNNMAEIDVSAAAVYGRAGAQRIAMENAAKTTIDLGYDKFIVVSTEGWNESTISGASHGSASGTPNYFSSSDSSAFSSIRHPESKLVIRMFHNGDKGSTNAVDARALLETSKAN